MCVEVVGEVVSVVDWSCSVVSVVYGFFFFKQKTAYEMRISDWSSDVCSSDLIATEAYGSTRPLDTSTGDIRLGNVGNRSEPSSASAEKLISVPKIGRASCRERVCQYV